MQHTVLLSQICLSVCLSDARIVTKRIVGQYLNTIRKGISLVFPLQQELLEIVLFHPKYSPKMTHPPFENADFDSAWITSHP